MLVHWIWLANRPDLNEREKVSLLQHFQDAEEIYYAQSQQLQPLGWSGEALDALLDKDLTEARKILDDCSDEDIRICTYRDATYPARLRNIPDPPIVLYYKGRLPDLDSIPALAVVGTRKATPYGINVAGKMAFQIVKCGAAVVTGLADGIDGAGARGALMADGVVIGVLGCGADRVYPTYHKSLYADCQRKGCLITEYPPGTPPYAWNFPKRNRIISGLSCGVVVVEAPEKSGALITARDALEQGRDVFCVPGNVDVPTFVGSNALLREGAILATCGWDVVSEYKDIYPGKVRLYGGPAPVQQQDTAEKPLKVAQKSASPKKKSIFGGKKDKKSIDNEEAKPYHVIHAELSEEEKILVTLLEKGEMLKDEVISRSCLPAAKVSSLLTMLQIKGIVADKPGNIWFLK